MKAAAVLQSDLPDRSEAGAVTEASFRIGDMYANGNGVSKDTSEAEKWYQRGAEMASAGAHAGWLTADVYLANAYLALHGRAAELWRGDVPDEGRSGTWKPASSSDLGSMYRDGEGTPQNYGEAMYWYRKAADHSPETSGGRSLAANCDKRQI